MTKKVIDIGSDFSPYPGGRYKKDGPYTGEHFRGKFLETFKNESHIEVRLDTTLGYGSSFLEEAFGGLVRSEGFSKEALREKLEFLTDDSALESEVWGYINDAEPK